MARKKRANENVLLVVSFFVLFLCIELMGLYIGNKLIGIEEIQPVTEAVWGAGVFVYILVATAIILLVIKYFKQLLVLFELLAIFLATEVFFEVLFMGILEPEIGFQAALVLAATLTLARHLKRNVITQNIAIILSITGIGALLGASFGLMPALVLMCLLAVYDIIAVFKTKHMVTMAKEITKQKLAFTIAIPTKKRLLQLGGGDLVMPLMFTVSVLREFGLKSALMTIAGSMFCLAILLTYILQGPKKAWPALPPVVIGALLGLAVSLFI